jgi:hypothetical protein
MTSRSRIIAAAEQYGWDWKITPFSKMVIMTSGQTTITVSFAIDGKIHTALIEIPGDTDRVNGGVPAVIDELRRFGK